MYHYTQDHIGRIIEYVELYRLLGVEKFFFYDTYNVEPVVDKLLKYYTESGVVDMRPWQFPMPAQQSRKLVVNGSRSNENPDDRLVFFGQQGALLDCVYRQVDEYKFLIVVDYDEFIMPKQHKTIPAMMRALEREYSENNASKVAGYTFPAFDICEAFALDNVTGTVIHDNTKHFRFTW